MKFFVFIVGYEKDRLSKKKPTIRVSPNKQPPMRISLANMADLKIEWSYIILKMPFGVCNTGAFLKSNWKEYC